MGVLMTDKLHVFERAGLGRAPFQFVGIERRVGPILLGGGVTVGAPGQPMGSCQFCGTGIAECCHIEDADGKTFIVGNVCVGKTGDHGLVNDVKRAVRRSQMERRHAQQDAVIGAGRKILEADAELRAQFASEPHPIDWAAKEGKTRLEWVEWMFKFAGRAGRQDVAKYITTRRDNR